MKKKQNKNFYYLMILLIFLGTTSMNAINSIENPEVITYCLEGDDLIDDDLCVDINGYYYGVFEEEDRFATLSIFIMAQFIITLFMILFLVISLAVFSNE